MSSPEETRKVVLSPRARKDFIDILRFTGETWGQRQLHIYRDRINDALQAIGRNPAIGRHSQALPETHRIYLVGPPKWLRAPAATRTTSIIARLAAALTSQLIVL